MSREKHFHFFGGREATTGNASAVRRLGGKFHLSKNFYCRMSMTSSNYARQVFRGNAAIVQKLATQFELYGLLLLVKKKNLSFGRTW